MPGHGSVGWTLDPEADCLTLGEFKRARAAEDKSAIPRRDRPLATPTGRLDLRGRRRWPGRGGRDGRAGGSKYTRNWKLGRLVVTLAGSELGTGGDVTAPVPFSRPIAATDIANLSVSNATGNLNTAHIRGR
jgi:hypothetical protein